MQPGDMITPNSSPPSGQPAPVESPQEEKAPDPKQEWSFQDDDEAQQDEVGPIGEVSWTASEFISHQKGASWYIGLAAITGFGSTIIFLFTHDWISLVMVLVAAILFGIFASRQPRVLAYKLDRSGITIGNRHYEYNQFKTFSIQREGAINSIVLVPLQRFMPGLTIYYPPEEEDRIIEVISSYLPHEERPPDVLDRFMRKVRF